MADQSIFLLACKIIRKRLRIRDASVLIISINGDDVTVHYPAIITSDWDDYPDNDNRIGNDYAS